MFPACKNSQKRVKNQKSTDKHSSFDGLIQEDIDLSDIHLAVSIYLFFVFRSNSEPEHVQHRLVNTALLLKGVKKD